MAGATSFLIHVEELANNGHATKNETWDLIAVTNCLLRPSLLHLSVCWIHDSNTCTTLDPPLKIHYCTMWLKQWPRSATYWQKNICC